MALQRHQLEAKAVFKALTQDDTFATVLHVICLVAYGPEIYELDILELRQRLSEDFHGELTEQNESKLNAILLATSTDIFYEQLEAFYGICSTLSEGDPGFELAPNLSVIDLMAGIYEVELNHGPHPFQPAVSAVIQQILEGESEDPEETEPESPTSTTLALQELRQRLELQLRGIGVEHPSLPSVEAQPPRLAPDTSLVVI